MHLEPESEALGVVQWVQGDVGDIGEGDLLNLLLRHSYSLPHWQEREQRNGQEQLTPALPTATPSWRRRFITLTRFLTQKEFGTRK